MICFRGRAHCLAYPERCGNAGCDRAMTRAREFDAARWWHDVMSTVGSVPNSPPPVDWMDFSPGCAERLPPVDSRLRGNDRGGGTDGAGGNDGECGTDVNAVVTDEIDAAAPVAGIGE